MSKKWRKKLILVAKISRVHTQMRCRPDNTSSSLFSVCNKRERERDRPISRKEMGAKNWHEGRETVSSHFLLPVVVCCLLANSKLLAGLCWNADMVGRGVCVCVCACVRVCVPCFVRTRSADRQVFCSQLIRFWFLPGKGYNIREWNRYFPDTGLYVA